jgi:SAM-dependent methyltransferase
VHNLPDDPAGRREWLEHWASEQRGTPSRATLARVRLQQRLKLARASVQQRVALRSEQFANRLLDRGLDTSGDAGEPEHDHPDRVRYVPSAWHVLPRALRYIGVSDHDTFVDFGCGKGRIVHQAAKRPFRRVIGVEISPALAEIARRNLAARRHEHRSRSVEIVVADATEFPVPDDLTIAYLFHPFKDETFETVLRGIIDSIDRHPRRVRLIYLDPVHGWDVLATGRFRLLTVLPWSLLDRRYRTAIFESL